MEQATSDAPGVLRLSVSGEIDLSTELPSSNGSLVKQRVVVDVSGVSFAGSGFLTWLLDIKKTADGLTLLHPSEAVLHLLEVAGMTDEFTIEPNGRPPR